MDCERTVAVDDCADPVVDIAIKEEISHPYFSKRNGNNDIALLRLAKDIPYTGTRNRACHSVLIANFRRIHSSYLFTTTGHPATTRRIPNDCMRLGSHRKW